MKHMLWLMPLNLGVALLTWCLEHPLAGSGREFLAILLILVSLVAIAFIRLDKPGNIESYEEIHANDH